MIIETITLLKVGGIVLGVSILIAAWPWIVGIFAEQIIPWLKKMDSVVPGIGVMVGDLIIFIDKGMSFLRRSAKDLIQMITVFVRTVAGIHSEVKQISPTIAECKTTTYIKTEQGKIFKNVRVDKVNYENLPDNVRKELNRLKTDEVARMDLKEAMVNQIKEKAQSEGMTLSEQI